MATGEALFTNGLIRTLHREMPIAEAVLTRDGRIVAVGSASDLRGIAGPDTRHVDLGGATLLPGFIETHNHFAAAGMANAHVDVRGHVVDSIGTMQRLLRERADQVGPEEWVLGRGYDQTLLAENRHPTKEDLDEAVWDRPAIIWHISYHTLVANSAALRMAGVNRDTPDVSGGEIVRDEHGEPTGLMLEAPAMDLVSRLLPPTTVDTIRMGLMMARDQYLPTGITTVHDALVNDKATIDAYAAAMLVGELPMRAYLMIAPELYDGELEGKGGDLGESYGLPKGRLIAGPVKLFQDGAIQAYTAALTQPYHDAPNEYGVKIYDPKQLHEMIVDHHTRGRQIAIHGNGDSAIDDILDGYEAALSVQPRDDHRHRIEHLQTAREDQIERMARLGVTSSVFINHLWWFGDRHLKRFLGRERAERMEPLASLSARGIRWALHSDCPVTEVNPLLGIWLAVNRRTSGGQQIGEEQKVDVEQALRGFGPDAAYLGFQEQELGTIAPGYFADFVALSGDPVADPERINELQVVRTFIDGETVWEA